MDQKTSDFKIDGYMLTAILIIFNTTTAVLFLPLTAAGVAKNDGWLAPLITVPAGVYLIFIYCWLGSLFPGKTLIEYLPLLLGKVIGKIVGLAYILFFIDFIAVIILENLALLLGTGVFKQTPGFAVILLLLLATTYAVLSGLEVISRGNLIFLGFILSAYMIFIIIAIPMAKFSSLLPIGDSGFKTILRSTLLAHAFRGEMIILTMLFPYVRSRRGTFISANIVNLFIGLYISITIVLCITIMGVANTAKSYYAPFSLADYLPIIGIKVFLVTIWILAFWGKISVGQYVITSGLAQVCGFKDHKFLILPVAVLLLVIAQAENIITTGLFDRVITTFPGDALVFEYGIPTLLALIALIKIILGHRPSTEANSDIIGRQETKGA